MMFSRSATRSTLDLQVYSIPISFGFGRCFVRGSRPATTPSQSRKAREPSVRTIVSAAPRRRAPAQGDTCIFPDFFGIATGDRLFGSAARVGRGVAPILLYDVKLKTLIDGISRAPSASMQAAIVAECTQERYIGADSRAAG